MAIADEKTLVLAGRLALLHLDCSTGSFSITERQSGHIWAPDPWLKAAGMLAVETPSGARREINLSQARRIEVEQSSDRVISLSFNTFPLPSNAGDLEASVHTRIALAEDESSFRIEVLDVRLPDSWTFVELEYPCRLGALRTEADDGYVVLPYRQGCLIPSSTRGMSPHSGFDPRAWDDNCRSDEAWRDLGVYSHAQITMPFYGIVHGHSALGVILETENDTGLRVVANNNGQRAFNRAMQFSPYERVAACSPIWKSEFRTFGYPRSMTISVLPGGDFNTIAKHYRRYAFKTGLAVTLNEKIDRNPNLDDLIGGPFLQLNAGYPFYIDYPIFRYKWNDVRTFIDFMTNTLKVKRGLLSLWVGYQNLPPDSWPFHPSQGTSDELKAMVQYARERHIHICWYHGYPALLDHAPNCDPARARWNTPRGDMSSRWGRHCSHFYVDYAKTNLPPTIADAGHSGDYTDILTSNGICECYGPGHEHSRTQDRRNKEATLAYINSLGLFTGSEHLQGYAVPFMAYSKWGTVGWRDWLNAAFPVPLFNLVYHDCFIPFAMGLMLPNSGTFRSFASGSQNHMVFFNWKMFMERRNDNWGDMSPFWEFQRLTGREELLSFKFEDSLDGPYRTQFGDGSEVYVNGERMRVTMSTGRRIEFGVKKAKLKVIES